MTDQDDTTCLDLSGVLWTHEQWHAKRHELESQLKADGLDGAELYFATQKAISDYQANQPTMRQRQAAAKKHSPTPPPSFCFTQDEIDWLKDKLNGTNEPLGRNILDKLDAQKQP